MSSTTTAIKLYDRDIDAANGMHTQHVEIAGQRRAVDHITHNIIFSAPNNTRLNTTEEDLTNE